MVSMTTTTLRGNLVREAPGRNRQYQHGRVCSTENCNTRLSVYNPGKTCSLHTPFKAPIMRGKKSSPIESAENGAPNPN
jgi:hypothetical protein